MLVAVALLLGIARPGTPPSIGRERGPLAAPADRTPDELGRIPILLYHELGDTAARWRRSRTQFRADLELLDARGYRPVGIGEVLDRSIDLPRGVSPVVITFDDAPPSQFRYIERPDGTLDIDSTSAVGMLLDFARTHPEWRNRAVFCVLTGADAGHSMFGGKEVDGQHLAWRHAKLRQLVALGFELCGHTDWHVNLGRVADSTVPGAIARGLLAIDSAVPGYRVRSFALPYGAWPHDSSLARAGRWADPASGRVVEYRFGAVFEAWGGTIPSPFDPAFRPLRLPRVQVTADHLERLLDDLDRHGRRYVSDGDPRTVARPPRAAPRH
jgi:peptidoglycan/xylan/chitin deacetylase (PgdA/CDA1 family)